MSSSFEGVMAISGSVTVVDSTGVGSASSTGAGWATGGSGCVVGSSTGSSGFVGSAGLQDLLASLVFKNHATPYFSIGSGAFLGAGGGAKILAQLFLTPSGIMLEAAFEAAAAGEETALVAVAPQLSSAGFSVEAWVSQAEAASFETAVSHALVSVVGTETGSFSLRDPFVCAIEAPRPLPPLPRSVPRPRPLPVSKPARPPRETLDRLVASPKDVTVASLTFDRDRSFFVFDTSPHCEIVPAFKCQYTANKASRRVRRLSRH